MGLILVCIIRFLIGLTLFRIGLFRVAQESGGGKRTPLPKIFHISYSDETLHSYTLPKEDPKSI